jgi:peptide/nickel transport system substrate-binding protein
MDGIQRRKLLLGLVLGGLATATGRALAQGAPRRGGTLTIGFEDSTKTLDPTYSVQFAERRVLYMMFNTLTAIDTDFSLRPELARSWQVENDGRRYVFQLQDGVKFHDGTDFDAEAVRFNLERRLDEAVASPQRNQLLPVIQSVEVVGRLTIAINLKQQYPALLSDMAA